MISIMVDMTMQATGTVSHTLRAQKELIYSTTLIGGGATGTQTIEIKKPMQTLLYQVAQTGMKADISGRMQITNGNGI